MKYILLIALLLTSCSKKPEPDLIDGVIKLLPVGTLVKTNAVVTNTYTYTHPGTNYSMPLIFTNFTINASAGRPHISSEWDQIIREIVRDEMRNQGFAKYRGTTTELVYTGSVSGVFITNVINNLMTNGVFNHYILTSTHHIDHGTNFLILQPDGMYHVEDTMRPPTDEQEKD